LLSLLDVEPLETDAVLELEEDTGILLELASPTEVVVLVVVDVETIVVVLALVVSEVLLVPDDELSISELEFVSDEVGFIDERSIEASSKKDWHENKTKVNNKVGIINTFFTRFPQNYFIMVLDEIDNVAFVCYCFAYYGWYFSCANRYYCGFICCGMVDHSYLANVSRESSLAIRLDSFFSHGNNLYQLDWTRCSLVF
jgi:hypothetical protein